MATHLDHLSVFATTGMLFMSKPETPRAMLSRRSAFRGQAGCALSAARLLLCVGQSSLF